MKDIPHLFSKPANQEVVMRLRWRRILMVLVAVGMMAAAMSAQAGILDKVKKKAKDKAEEKVDKEVDKALEGKEEEKKEEAQTQEGDQPEQAGEGTAVAEDMTLYTKYDFIPGDKVIFYDDMSGEEVSEFPLRWRLESGVYEVVKLGKEFWIMCTNGGPIRPKMPDAPLPPKYTVELKFYNHGPKFSNRGFKIHWVDSNGRNIGSFESYGQATGLAILGKGLANKRLSNSLTKGVHTMRIMATNRSIKCYIDEVRVANVPKVENFNPVGFRLEPDYWNIPKSPILFRGFRFAEGGKSMREQLDETGKIVTHGILFDVDSHRIKGESYKTLKQIGQLLQDDPDLRLSIEGHTDSDGSDEHNLTLSQNRANSVRDYLISTYSIDAGRLEAKGWGESKPIDTNDSPEGKANNRRVELVKL